MRKLTTTLIILALLSIAPASQADTAPTVTILNPTGQVAAGIVTINGTATDDIGIDRIKLFVQNEDTGKYWNGAAWVTPWSWFDPGGTTTWTYDIDLDGGYYETIAWAWDTNNNISPLDRRFFTVTAHQHAYLPVHINGPDSTGYVSIPTDGTILGVDIMPQCLGFDIAHYHIGHYPAGTPVNQNTATSIGEVSHDLDDELESFGADYATNVEGGGVIEVRAEDAPACVSVVLVEWGRTK